MSLTQKDVEHIAELARLRLTDSEIKQFGGQLSSILDYVQALAEVDTSGVSETARVAELENVSRKDEVKGYPASTRALLLEDMPAHSEDLLKVPPVFDSQPKDF
ncbi:MAG: Asp-tRNA(Asn)/Glu-tRNA(Gln) amidotransferase subunit GatC [bacterium]|nr:Asp-tRNA(Asn)/Glu-tRNA(Gln) amidotransferase subunit GatC [bacterium]